ncbi:MAG: LptA/OstA family protein, partial [Bryobacteraceae bacterium]
AYGSGNRIESFRAAVVSTRTDNQEAKGSSPEPPSLTWSDDLAAEFEPKTSRLIKLEQWNDFRYEQGDRKAKADRALLEPARDVVTLTGSARMWDPSGSTSAGKIILNQKTGDLEAVGTVSSTRLPERKQKPATSSLLSAEEPIQAKAERMLASDDRSRIEYQGNALLWQGANRLQAHQIEIDRKQGKLHARQNVFSQFLDNSPKGKRNVFTTVRAAELTYSEKEQIAHYRGGAVLNRPGLQVDAQEIQAFFAGGDKDSSDSSLEKAIADGSVKIVQTAPDRTRTGTSEHAEYFAASGKIVLEEGQPQLVDSFRGTAKGKQLTYFSNDDRLLIDGSEGQPASSTIRRR